MIKNIPRIIVPDNGTQKGDNIQIHDKVIAFKSFNEISINNNISNILRVINGGVGHCLKYLKFMMLTPSTAYWRWLELILIFDPLLVNAPTFDKSQGGRYL